MAMRILITGASGFIGSHLACEAVRAGWQTYGTYRSHPIEIPCCEMQRIDLAYREATLALIGQLCPQVIVHAAADANMDRCEENPEQAHRNNVVATENVVEGARSVGAYVVLISTDAVFDGERGFYAEEDLPNPTSVYARTKLLAESTVLGRTAGAVVRTSINYGHRLAPHQGSFHRDILNALQAGRSIPVFYDQFRNPIEVGHLARALLDLARIRYAGLLHIAGSQRCSRQDFAQAICRQFGLPTGLLIPKSEAEVAFRVRRPRDISMRVDKAQSLLGTPLPSLEMGLRALSSSDASGAERSEVE